MKVVRPGWFNPEERAMWEKFSEQLSAKGFELCATKTVESEPPAVTSDGWTLIGGDLVPPLIATLWLRKNHKPRF